MEFRDGKVAHETHYYADPFEPPEWRSQWVEIIHDDLKDEKERSSFSIATQIESILAWHKIRLNFSVLCFELVQLHSLQV
jgi:hypothetical protein